MVLLIVSITPEFEVSRKKTKETKHSKNLFYFDSYSVYCPDELAVIIT